MPIVAAAGSGLQYSTNAERMSDKTASTGAASQSVKNPRSKVGSQTRKTTLEMGPRPREHTPQDAQHFGQVAEAHSSDPSVVWRVPDGGEDMKGVVTCKEWHEYGGKRYLITAGYLLRRMLWVTRSGQWHGQWEWEAYDRDNEWKKGWLGPGINRRWRDMGNGTRNFNAMHRSGAASNAASVPQEVLLCVVHRLDEVSATGLLLYQSIIRAYLIKGSVDTRSCKFDMQSMVCYMCTQTLPPDFLLALPGSPQEVGSRPISVW